MLLVVMLFCSVSSVLADDSNLITQQITVNVSKAGTLKDKIGSNRKNQITNLKITGTLNVDDFDYIEKLGNLQFLDLKDVQLVDGKSSHVISIYDSPEYIEISESGTKISGPFFYLFLSDSLQPMSVILPNNITCLGDYCFWQCRLESITIPSGVTEIGDNAYMKGRNYDRASVASIYVEMPIPSKIGVTHFFSEYAIEIGTNDDPFIGFTKPFELYVPKGSRYLYKNSAWGKDKEVNIKEYDLMPSDELITQQKIVNVSEAGTLRNYIDKNDINKITNLKVSGQLNIDDVAFIREMAGCCYQACGPRYPGHLYHLDLKDVQFVESDKSLPIFGYSGTDSNSAYIDKTPCALFANLYDLQSIELPGNLNTVGYEMLKGCESLTSLVIPSGVTSIGDYAFSGCSGLTSLNIPSGVTSIGDYAFSGCRGLTSLKIPSGVTSIGDYAFSGCSGLTSLEIPSGVTSIGDYTFYGCSGLTSLKIPSGVTSIGKSAFSGCRGLTSLEIPSGVTSIGDYTFYGCYGLTSLSIPASITSIGKDAFKGCSSLTSVYAYMTSPVALNADAFCSVNKNKCTLYIPQGSYFDYLIAPGWDYFNKIVEFAPTGIDKVTTKSDAKEISRYSVDGQKLDAPVKGLNIVKYSDGSIQKVIVK